MEAQAVEKAVAEEKERAKAQRKARDAARLSPDPEAATATLLPAAPQQLSDSSDDEVDSGPNSCDCAPEPGSRRHALGEIMNGSLSSNISTGLVLLNLVLMCMPYATMSVEYEEQLEFGATIISWLFIIEMALKLVGFGCAGYWADGWNQLDGTIVTMSIVEMILTAIFAGSGVKLSFLRILRMLRIARMLRLMKSWKGLYKVISTVVRAMPQMSNVIILVALINMIFALLGMQLFGGQFNEEFGYGDPLVDPALAPLPRYNFDYFIPSIITVFIITTGGW